MYLVYIGIVFAHSLPSTSKVNYLLGFGVQGWVGYRLPWVGAL